jgi:hypothetical protein
MGLEAFYLCSHVAIPETDTTSARNKITVYIIEIEDGTP